MKAKNAAALGGLGLGFLVGGVAGLAWGKATRSRVPGTTSTSYDDGVLTVEFDAATAALGSLSNYLR